MYTLHIIHSLITFPSLTPHHSLFSLYNLLPIYYIAPAVTTAPAPKAAKKKKVTISDADFNDIKQLLKLKLRSHEEVYTTWIQYSACVFMRSFESVFVIVFVV